MKKITESFAEFMGIKTHLEDTAQKTYSQYFDEVDPETGFKYSIPGLSRDNNNYVAEYVDMMKLKETDPKKFEKILNFE